MVLRTLASHHLMTLINYYNGLVDHPENIDDLRQKSAYQRYIMCATIRS